MRRLGQRSLMALAGIACCAHIASAEDHPLDKTVDFYAAFGATVAPDVEESATGALGTSNYTWNDSKDDYGMRLALGHLICAGGPDSGSSLGIELTASTANITPASYDVGGVSFTNTSSRTLRYTTAGALLHYGYQFGSIPQSEELHAFLFLAPFVGGGAAWADSEVRDAMGTYAGERGLGWYVEGGLRLGFAFAERHFVLGAMVDGVIGTSRVKINFGNGTNSELTLDRLGVGGAIFLGYRL